MLSGRGDLLDGRWSAFRRGSCNRQRWQECQFLFWLQNWLLLRTARPVSSSWQRLWAKVRVAYGEPDPCLLPAVEPSRDGSDGVPRGVQCSVVQSTFSLQSVCLCLIFVCGGGWVIADPMKLVMVWQQRYDS